MHRLMDKIEVQIIDCIRHNKKISLFDLYAKFFAEREMVWSRPEETLCRYLADLCVIGFVDISSKIDGTEENLMLQKGTSNIEIFSFLRSALLESMELRKYDDTQSVASNICLTISDKFYDVQRIIGFSITDEIRELQIREQQEAIFGSISFDAHTDIFVAMPFNEAFNPIYEEHIKKVCDKKLLSCLRVDRINRASSIINDIWSGINSAKAVIADCTGKNANVFYEIGIAHALGKRVILITQKSEDIPFDINRIRYIKYENTVEGLKNFDVRLGEFLGEEIRALSKPHSLVKW